MPLNLRRHGSESCLQSVARAPKHARTATVASSRSNCCAITNRADLDECFVGADGTEPETAGILLRYLDRIAAAGSRPLREGFAAVLTDYIASAVDGATACAEHYELIFLESDCEP